MTELVTVDIGGTHTRFAVAEVGGGKVLRLGPATTIRTAEHASFESAWEAFGQSEARPLPRAAAIAVAGPVTADLIRCTNNSWTIRRAGLSEALGVDRHIVINDFAAVAHAVAQAQSEDFLHLCGPEEPLPDEGAITVVGPGTGLGVAHLQRTSGSYVVQATEGGHIGFAPVDAIDDVILAQLREKYSRVSAERVVSGPGLAPIFMALAQLRGEAVRESSDEELWTEALNSEQSLATEALERFCLALGSVAGDLALAQGAAAVVIAGGLGYRVRDHLVRSGFAGRFRAKGRFEPMMARLPVKLIVHPQPGLFGAAAAFAQTCERT